MQVKHELKYCERCSAEFVCNAGDVLDCQCSSIQISEQTQQFLLEKNYDCLCINCLVQLNNKINNTTALTLFRPSYTKNNVLFK
jgi:hypothetical protein